MTKRVLTTQTSAGDAAPEAREHQALVSFDGVWRYWGHGKKRWAILRGINLDVPPGTAVQVSGSNGAGKTTLLRIATAILSPHQGTVTIGGIPSDGNWREYHRQIGFLSAGDRGLYARFSVRGHLEYGVRLAFVAGGRRKQAVEESLFRFGLTELVGLRADRLSQGQRQRLRLALTFVHEPRVLLLDEPRNSLDTDGLAMLVDAVGKVLTSGGAVIWCSPAGESQPVKFDRSLVIEEGTLRPE